MAQVLAWGSSYYLPAVLAGPVVDDTGWPLAWVVGALSIGLLVSGLVSPRIGHIIERRGGRPVLAASAVLLAVGLLGLALAPNLPLFIVAWVVIGFGMGAGLYDPAFSALGRLYGEDARPVITQVTLFGGFASTVCWPLTAFLAAHLGWRGACLTYAALMVVVVLPLYLLALPREEERLPKPVMTGSPPPGHVRPDQRAAFLLLAAGFTLAYGTMTVIGVHLLMLLQAQGLALAAAVGLGTLIGPAQVGGRILEMAFGKKAHPIWGLVASSILVAVGLGLLVGVPGIAAASIVLYGMGSGIRSIARGTVPLALFGREGYAILMGRLALPTLLATAAAPLIGAWLLDGLGPHGTLVVLCGAALVNVALVLPLVPMALKSQEPQ
ncbi:MFS transporter [Paeniroseomonas aquatica]|uniref:MFS transporter n=1 Tax=Paeniroseomonas aquatica TaxID=373043 RepID=A0ABT8A367_9PROT|nr:MFS transporter [Paeniroseomonas aquatica]MDN3564154.1 MFS transporter [Paeniroseomonas aquatica]